MDEAAPSTKRQERNQAGLVFLLTLGLAIRIVWVGLVPNEQVADFKMYDEMAASFYRGFGYTDVLGRPSAFKPPGYPLLLALIYHVFGESPFAAKVINANLSTLLCLLVFLLTRRLFDERWAFVALTLCVLHPTFVFSVSLLGTEIPFCCLTMAAVLVLLSRPPGHDVPSSNAALAGLAFGAAGLMRPMALLAPAALVIWLLVDGRPMGSILRTLVVFCLTLVVPILPWTVRNYLAFHKIVPVSTNGGFNLFYGHNPLGEVVWLPHERLQQLPGFPDDQTWQAWDEPTRSKYMQRQAYDYIATDPAGVFRRMPMKFYLLMLAPDVPSLYWNVEGLPEACRPSQQTLTLLATVNRVFAYGILLFAALGVATTGLSDRRLAFIYALLAIWIGFHLVYWGKPRFRYPLVPYWIILAAGPMASVSARLRRALR